MNITVIKSPKIGQRTRPKDSELGFGKLLTDHMFLMDYTTAKGWHDARIVPYAPLQMDPAAMVLHYGQEVFEGLKAYQLKNGGVGLFRPQKNIERMNRSAARMVMPQVDPDLFMQAMKELIALERAWLPTSEGTSIYIRPTMIANEAALGVKPSSRYLFFIIMGPVGPYYPEGFNPTSIYVTSEYVRAAKGGVGEFKTSCNYGPTLYASKMAAEKGYTQVLWLDAKEHRYVEEVGTSNIFFYLQDELVTPPLGGTILPGVTRDSVLTLARHWGMKVSERPITIDEAADACRTGKMKEVFATGTAAVVSPVGKLCLDGQDIQVADGKVGELSRKLYDTIFGIQYGKTEDPFGWSVQIV